MGEEIESFEMGRAPVGSRLERPGTPLNRFGTFGILTPVSEELLTHARRALPEIPNERLRQEGKLLIDSATDVRYQMARGFIDWVSVNISAPQVRAFSVRDGHLVPLALEGQTGQPEQSVYMGSMHATPVRARTAAPDSGVRIL